MELYPNDQQLQKSALIFLYSEQMLENISSQRFKCTKLVMNTLVNFKEKEMISMASVICSTCLMRLSIEEREILGSRNVYIKSLLNIVDSYSYNDLIENTLSTLVNLLIDSSKNCKILVELKGFDVLFSLLEVKLNQWSKK
jgi:hypothetical protein